MHTLLNPAVTSESAGCFLLESFSLGLETLSPPALLLPLSVCVSFSGDLVFLFHLLSLYLGVLALVL